jgi:hypothetical protein
MRTSRTPTTRSWTKATRSRTYGRCGRLDVWTDKHVHASSLPSVQPQYIAPIGTVPVGAFFWTLPPPHLKSYCEWLPAGTHWNALVRVDDRFQQMHEQLDRMNRRSRRPSGDAVAHWAPRRGRAGAEGRRGSSGTSLDRRPPSGAPAHVSAPTQISTLRSRSRTCSRPHNFGDKTHNSPQSSSIS